MWFDPEFTGDPHDPFEIGFAIERPPSASINQQPLIGIPHDSLELEASLDTSLDQPSLSTAKIDAGPRLPPELCDYIIDELSLSYGTLPVCALVCRAWLPRVRYHRWNRIQLSESNVPKLVMLLHRVPDVAPYMKHLDLVLEEDVGSMPMEDYDEPFDNMDQPLLVEDDVLLDDLGASIELNMAVRKDASLEDLIDALFSKLTNLESLEFDGGYIKPQYFRHLLRLRYVGFWNCGVTSWKDVRTVLQILPQLQTIFFKRVWCACTPTRPFPHYSAVSPLLNKVVFAASPDLLSEFSELFLVGTSRPSIVDLVVGSLFPLKSYHTGKPRPDHGRLTLGMVFSLMGDDLSDDEEDRDLLYLNELDSSVRIHSVEIVPSWDYGPATTFPSIFSWLVHIPGDIRTLCITIWLRDAAHLQLEEWWNIVDTAKSPKFSSLEQFEIHFLDSGRNPGLVDRIQFVLEIQFSIFVERGIFAFRRVKSQEFALRELELEQKDREDREDQEDSDYEYEDDEDEESESEGEGEDEDEDENEDEDEEMEDEDEEQEVVMEGSDKSAAEGEGR